MQYPHCNDENSEVILLRFDDEYYVILKTFFSLRQVLKNKKSFQELAHRTSSCRRSTNYETMIMKSKENVLMMKDIHTINEHAFH